MFNPFYWFLLNHVRFKAEWEDKKMNKTQFTMLGMTGSGKTCYLLGMYKKMLAGLKGFSLTTDDDTDVNLRRRYNRMDDAALGQDRFPAGTDQTDFYDFSLEYALSSIMSFRWIDYPGGMLEAKTDGDIEQYTKLEEYVKNSSSFFICVDGALLQGDDSEEKMELLQERCSSLINPFLSRYLKNNKFFPPTAIIITKCDLCMNDTSNDDLEEILQEVFSPLFVSGSDSNRFISIIPVSIGKNISENNYRGKLSPKNLQLPIFMGVWFALISYGNDLARRIAEKKSDRERLIRARDNEANSFWLWRDDDMVTHLRREAEMLGQQLPKDQKRYIKAIQDGDRLLEELENKVKMVYFNGTKYESFTEAATKYIDTRR